MINFSLDTAEQRWRMLEPFMHVYGPADSRPRPAVILFHGCAGMRPHIETYAKAAAEEGFRAFVIDSYGARGWNQAWATTIVCTGAAFWGRERAGDVLAAAMGISTRSDVDATRLCLAGWSHGSWSIMDLMTMALDRPGEAGLQDPSPQWLNGVRSLFLAYPYGGPGALSRSRGWVRGAETLAIVCEKDHITGQADSLRIFDAPRNCETTVHMWVAPGTHAFDAPGHEGFPSPMRYDPDLAEECVGRFRTFIRRTLDAGLPSLAAIASAAAVETAAE
jgi:dienelactone hydrolase